LGSGDADRVLKGGLTLVELIFGEQNRPGKAVQFRTDMQRKSDGCRY
jgi:hypothetical protein